MPGAWDPIQQGKGDKNNQRLRVDNAKNTMKLNTDYKRIDGDIFLGGGDWRYRSAHNHRRRGCSSAVSMSPPFLIDINVCLLEQKIEPRWFLPWCQRSTNFGSN